MTIRSAWRIVLSRCAITTRVTANRASDVATTAWVWLSSALVASSTAGCAAGGDGPGDHDALTLSAGQRVDALAISVCMPIGICLMSASTAASRAASQACSTGSRCRADILVDASRGELAVLQDDAELAAYRAWCREYSGPCPSKNTAPDSGCSKPSINRSSDDFPLPDGPTIATYSPGVTFSVTSVEHRCAALRIAKGHPRQLDLARQVSRRSQVIGYFGRRRNQRLQAGQMRNGNEGFADARAQAPTEPMVWRTPC